MPDFILMLVVQAATTVFFARLVRAFGSSRFRLDVLLIALTFAACDVVGYLVHVWQTSSLR